MLEIFIALISLAAGFAAASLFGYLHRKPEKNSSINDKLADAIVSADAGFYLFNFSRNEEYFSPTLLQLLELDDFVNQFDKLEAIFEEDSFAALKDAISALRRGKSTIRLQLKTRPGKDIECRAHAQHDVNGGPKSFVLWFRDITDNQKHLSRLIRESDKLKIELKNFSVILNTLSYPVWRRGKDLAIKFCNLAYSEAAEEAPEKVMRSEELELHRNAKLLAQQALDSGKPVKERRHIIIGGQRRFFDIFEIPLPQEEMVVGFAQDITEIEKLHEEMQRYVSAQADLLESSASAMAIYGPDMRLKSYNYAFASLWRLEEGWLDTEPTYSEILELLREKRKLPEQANFPAFKQQQVRLFIDLIGPHEEFFYLPDGKTLRVIAIPHALGGLLFAYEDVTDRLALERSYNTLIAVQKETLNRLQEGIAVFGEDGRLRLFNPTYLELWSLNEEDAAKEPHIRDVLDLTRSFFKPDQLDKFQKEVMQHSHIRAFSHQRLERTDGSVIDWSAVPLPDGAILFTFADVTAVTLVERSLREKNDALEEADKLKTEFLANVSYELRSPLTSISGFSEMLRQDYFGALTSKQREYVDGILHSAAELTHLINDILDLATIEAGFMRLEVTRFGVQPMLASVLALVRARAKEEGIKLKLSCPARIGTLLADETRIKQVLFNLLNNAIKYTEKGGEVTLGATDVNPHELILWVKDTGIGIAPEEQQAVFNKFFKGSGGTTPGTGLGLPMVKSFIELHGGRVELTSIPGEGTEISCHLLRNNPNLEQYAKGAA